jgi:CRP-like cAMP-binding protein
VTAVEDLRDIETAHELWTLTARELLAQNHLLLLNKTAPERVASFLLEMTERVEELAMSRQDIADHHRDRLADADAIRERVRHRVCATAPLSSG